MTTNSRQALVADIGGTFISFAIADIDELTISHFALLSTADFKSPMEAVTRYLASLQTVPDKASFAIAGQLHGDHIKMTHRSWSISDKDIRAATGAEFVTMLNDLDALALSLPHLTNYELIEIGERPVKYGNKVVINSGTGLGIAGLVWSGEQWVSVCGEGGQVALPAMPANEFDIRSALAEKGYVSAEDLFSGYGLVALYDALARSKKAAPKSMTAPQINKLGLSGEDKVAVQALDLMARWLARFAGDVALMYGARGGVYLAGGLSAGIVPHIDRQAFRAAFADKGTMRDYLGALSISVIKTGADAGLRGAAVALARSLPASASLGRRSARAM